jgi:hypothetical protein
MARRDTLLRFIDQMAGRVRVNTDADTDLLERFVATRDNHSFAALVDRHGQMVLQVCLRVLGHSADAEDAAQAVFLVLALKAGTLRDPANGPESSRGKTKQPARDPAPHAIASGPSP